MERMKENANRDSAKLEQGAKSRQTTVGPVVTTRELFAMTRRRHHPVEAHLVLNYGLRATHWFTYLGKGIYLTEGIDGVEDKMTAREFARIYAWLGTDPVWHLDYF